MKESYTFVAISGSLRKGSYNTMALKAAQQLAPGNIFIEQLSIAEIPMYNADLHVKEFPEPVNKLADAVKDADAVIIVTPEYNYSIPGVLKNTIDFLSKHPAKPFNMKAVGIMSASPGLLGGVRAQYHLRQILVAVNAMCINIPEVMISQANSKFDEQGNLTDDKIKEFIQRFIQALAAFSYTLEEPAEMIK